MLGSLQPWQTGPEVFRRGFEIDRVRTDMWMLDIHSPEALMARQVASQRTAACIPGDGPIQSDLFPILEYAAPKAFFKHQFTAILEAYDERTHQQLLAPPEKRALLASLPATQVQMIFGSFLSMNRKLYETIMDPSAHPELPSVFQMPGPARRPGPGENVYDAAAQAFAAGNVVQARQLMNYALQMNPQDGRAAFLARVFNRAAGIQPLPR
jgi:hypothetical protein